MSDLLYLNELELEFADQKEKCLFALIHIIKRLTFRKDAPCQVTREMFIELLAKAFERKHLISKYELF